MTDEYLQSVRNDYWSMCILRVMKGYGYTFKEVEEMTTSQLFLLYNHLLEEG